MFPASRPYTQILHRGSATCRRAAASSDEGGGARGKEGPGKGGADPSHLWLCTGSVEGAVHEGEAVEARERGQGVHRQRPAQLRVVLHVEVEQSERDEVGIR